MESKDISSFFMTIQSFREKKNRMLWPLLFTISITKSDFVIKSISIPPRSGFQFRPRAPSLLIIPSSQSAHVKVSFTLTGERERPVDSDPMILLLLLVHWDQEVVKNSVRRDL